MTIGAGSRRWLAALAGLASAVLAGCGSAGAGALVAATGPYEHPGKLARLPDGRRINLNCRGSGSPTVLLESGYAAGASAWAKVQPRLSAITRVCAYDRAGYGFSDLGPLPRDGQAIARDLDLALKAARIGGPFVVVGHSAGGLYGRLFAARRPHDVAGLVLLDPTVERRAPQPEGDGLDGLRRRVDHCIETASRKPQPPDGDSAWSGCISSKAGAQAARLAHDPAVWASQRSELDNIFGRTSEQVLRLPPSLLADVPAYVLTASQTAGATPLLGLDPQMTALEAAHRGIAARFRVGFQSTVVSSHLIMIDRPDVVVEAVEEMVAAARERRAPAPLHTSENRSIPTEDSLKALLPDASAPQGPVTN